MWQFSSINQVHGDKLPACCEQMIIDTRFLLAMLHSLDFLFILLLLGIFDPTELINEIRQLYKTREEWLSPFPWCEEFQFFLGNIFTRLKVVRRKKTRGEISNVFVDMSSILDPSDPYDEENLV